METVNLNKTRDFYTVGDGHYILDCMNADGVMFEATRIRRDQYGELRGSLDVRVTLAGAMVLDDLGTIIRFDSINLSDSRKRKDAANDCQRRAKTSTGDVDWIGLLDQFAFKVGSADSRGDAAVWLPDVPRSTADAVYNLDGFPILRNHPQIVFGDGGSLKSWLMLYWAGQLARQGVPTMYCDWEMTEEDHRERAAMIWGDHVPKILYVRCLRALPNEIDRLAQLKHEHQISFGFFDSIGFACPGKPEDAVSALQYMTAIRSLGIGTMHSAHIASAAEMKEHRPFGSVFWHNSARQTWFVKAEEGSTAETARSVALINRKYSITRAHAARAFRFDFEPNVVRIAKADPTTVETAVKDVPMWQRIKAVVTSHPLTFAEIAEATGLKEDSIRKSVDRASRTFKVIEGSNGLKRVALLELRAVS